MSVKGLTGRRDAVEWSVLGGLRHAGLPESFTVRSDNLKRAPGARGSGPRPDERARRRQAARRERDVKMQARLRKRGREELKTGEFDHGSD